MDNVIEIDLDLRDEYVNEYDDRRISDELHNFIMASNFDVKQAVVVRVKVHFEVSEKEQEFMKKMLYDDFRVTLDITKEEIRRSNVQDMLLLLMGFLLFFLSYFFGVVHMNLFSEFFLVITWVAFWQVAEDFLFYRRKIVIRRKKYQRLVDSKIDILVK